jgi:hypothetical protein
MRLAVSLSMRALYFSAVWFEFTAFHERGAHEFAFLLRGLRLMCMFPFLLCWRWIPELPL